jgi:hypothetical protein
MMLEHPAREAISDVYGASLTLIERDQFVLVPPVEHPIELITGLREKLGSKTFAIRVGQTAEHRHLPHTTASPAGPHPCTGCSPVTISIGKMPLQAQSCTPTPSGSQVPLGDWAQSENSGPSPAERRLRLSLCLLPRE